MTTTMRFRGPGAQLLSAQPRFRHRQMSIHDDEEMTAANVPLLPNPSPSTYRWLPDGQKFATSLGDGPPPSYVDDDIGSSAPAVKFPVDEIRYSQQSISGKFTCGRTLKNLIMLLDQGDPECDPYKADFLVLDAIRISGVHFALDNRRLFCLKQHQKHQRRSQPSCTVMARLRIVATVENLHAMNQIQLFDPTWLDKAEGCTVVSSKRARKKKRTLKTIKRARTKKCGRRCNGFQC